MRAVTLAVQFALAVAVLAQINTTCIDQCTGAALLLNDCNDLEDAPCICGAGFLNIVGPCLTKECDANSAKLVTDAIKQVCPEAVIPTKASSNKVLAAAEDRQRGECCGVVRSDGKITTQARCAKGLTCAGLGPREVLNLLGQAHHTNYNYFTGVCIDLGDIETH
ncbi:hypothetical protein BOTBODRAFT_43701 [Botryobasidium botryosum FD-172 SS1]|uniref:CFEM domain-containing protein n=1 Tax=Botryobasidium botryosum (strain FD-172 SS1) TaxID=930990 RepID=A0A067MK16_BOTB1|nr:hypothetical protein BOTBODRAFT_43701 [Botryobasidium botryosum FD-172 SS1]